MIDRYGCAGYQYEKSDTGQFVKYDDHRSEVDELTIQIEDLESQVDNLTIELSEANARRADRDDAPFPNWPA